ncbi:MBL fold metallo-hydrolase [Thermodesulfobacteriota bacterium]
MIEIRQEMLGFNEFIGSWVCRGDENIIVDAGPANSVKRLIESLISIDVKRLDYIFLTHIHLDHAGGLSALLDHFPNTKVICHKKGIKHLVDPSRLWSGTLKTIGKLAKSYGPIKPLKREKLIPHTDVHIKDLKIIETPGHAAHHLSFFYKGTIFSGEAGGNYFRVQGMDYLRPATPARFFLQETLDSVKRLIDLSDQGICYAHFGESKHSCRMLNRYQDQLLRWKKVIKNEITANDSYLVERCVERLLQEDPDLRAYKFMDPDTQNRERFFVANSVRGYLGFLKTGY